MKKNIPAISVIIPMYNAEKYIGECLDSIFAQTFQDFEVIVVDDCSTDNSCAIVENYIQTHKRGGVEKLKLIRSDKNSEGHPGIPRNIGMRFAIGEYLYFMDSDDAITETALAEIYPIAKISNADILTCWDYYTTTDENIPKDKKLLKKHSEEAKNPFKVPVLIAENLEERTKYFCMKIFTTTMWNNLVRREFIAQHEITFPKLRTNQDTAFYFFAMCYAKKMVGIPNIFYIWRTRDLSNSRKVRTPEDTIHMRGSTIFNQIKILDDFMNNFEFFQSNKNYKYAVIDYFIVGIIEPLLNICSQTPVYQLDEFIRHELDKIEDKTPLTAFLFSRMAIFNVQLNQQSARLKQMQTHIQKQGTALQQQLEIIQNQATRIKRLEANANLEKIL